jgi:hypothetical protein
MDSRHASPHVLWAELECHTKPNPTPYPLDWRATKLPPLLCVFEAIRAIWGTVMPITSAYRTRAYNKAIGGAPLSRHCEGDAIDAEPPQDVTPEECYARVVALAKERPDLGIHYICGYAACPEKPRGQIHVDRRPGTTLVTEWVNAHGAVVAHEVSRVGT